MKTLFTKEEARKFLVLYFGLNKLDTLGVGKQGIQNYFNRVHSIQYDPLNIVGKNTEITLAARFSDFTPALLDEMLYKDKLLVDGFDKEACIYLMSDWKEFHHVRVSHSRAVLAHPSYQNEQSSPDNLNAIYSFVEKNPTCCSKDIQIGATTNNGWGSSSVSNRLLHYFWCKGDFVVDERRNGNKYYALSKQVIPKEIYSKEKLDDEQFMEWFFLRRLEALGFYWLKRGSGWLGKHFSNMKELKLLAQKMLKKQEIIEIEIEGMKDKFYITNRNYELLLQSEDEELIESIRFIAPLDNFIWDRKLINELFGFEYTWEVYVPEAKRKYGYYVLPVLYRDKLIARIEPSRDKERVNKLEIQNIWFEDDCYNTKEMMYLIEEEVLRFNQQMNI